MGAKVDLLTVQETAEVLGVSADRVRQMRRRGQLTPAVTLTGPRYLFLASEVEKERVARALVPPLNRPRPGMRRAWAAKRAAKEQSRAAA